MGGMPEFDTVTLPPLILHPFATPHDAPTLLEATRASLMQHNLLPCTMGTELITDTILRGRYCEMRWLYFIGRDIVRWIEQCLEFTHLHAGLNEPRVNFQAFAHFLTECPPPGVKDKLLHWGVFDFRRVFGRALGLNSVFTEFPPIDLITEEFVREYYSFSDNLFACRQKLNAYSFLDPQKLRFEIYTSREYLKILESGFGGN
jgi:hypothetical protein